MTAWSAGSVLSCSLLKIWEASQEKNKSFLGEKQTKNSYLFFLSPHSTGLIVAFSLSMIPEFRQVAISACDVTFKDSKVEETIRLARIEAEVAAETNEALMQA